MKTYKEACALFRQKTSVGSIAAGKPSAEAQAQRDEFNSRYREIHAEVQNSEEFETLFQSHMIQLANGSISIEHMVYSVFVYGIAVGMEMEKQL